MKQFDAGDSRGTPRARRRQPSIPTCRDRTRLSGAGLLVTFEGIDGCGKSTQARLFFRRLKKQGWPAIFTKEPGGTPAGKKIRGLLLDPRIHLEPTVEIFLFAADRHQHVLTVIKPALAAGKIVVCDRYLDSTIAYQVGGRGLNRRLVENLNRLSSLGLEPDLTFIFDLPVSLCRRRLGKKKDRFHDQGDGFQEQVRREYLRIIRRRPKSIIVVRQRGSISQVAREVWDKCLIK